MGEGTFCSPNCRWSIEDRHRNPEEEVEAVLKNCAPEDIVEVAVPTYLRDLQKENEKVAATFLPLLERNSDR